MQEERAQAQVIGFLTGDLLRQRDPGIGEGQAETLAQAIEAILPQVDRRFADQKRIAATIHGILARALDNASQLQAAGEQYDASARAWREEEGPRGEGGVGGFGV